MIGNNQVELPFEQGGFTQSIEALLQIYALKRKSRGPRRTAKPDLTGIDLNQSLLPDTVWGIEHAWMPDEDQKKEELTTDPTTDGRYKDLPDRGRNCEFSPPTFEVIALLASKVIYSVLNSLWNDRGNADDKREHLDWLFATTYRHDCVEWRKPMHKIPFTAQYCCMVEEIDYELLCEAINDQIESLRERQAPFNEVPAPIKTTEGPIYVQKDNTRALWSQIACPH